jgi:hypothetical protein
MANESATPGHFFAAWKILRGRLPPLVCDKGADNQTLHSGENHFRLLRLGVADFPRVSGRFIQGTVGSTPVYVYQECSVPKYRGFGSVPTDNLLGVHGAKIGASRSAGYVGEARIGIDESRFDLAGRLIVHSMAMDDMSDLEASQANFSNAFELIIDLIAFQVGFGTYVRKDPISPAFSNIERFTVSRINESVNVRLQLA